MVDSLHIELRSLNAGPASRELRLPVEGGPFADAGVEMLEEPALSFVARATGDGAVHVTGLLSARVRLACRRCLAEREEMIELPLDLRFDPKVEPGDEDEGAFPLRAEADAIDLGPALREEVLLRMPEYPVCRDECAGLCPVCGVDLNVEGCDCARTDGDPRWDALRELRG